MLYQAHRGVSTDYPENTMPAFCAAVEQGYHTIEIDVRVTADGQFVLLHDKTLNRTGRHPDGSSIADTIALGDIPYERTKQYDFGLHKGEAFRGTYLPLFTEVLAFARESGILLKLDRQYMGFTEEQRGNFYTLLTKWQDVACLTCGDVDTLRYVRDRMPTMQFHYDGPITEAILAELSSLLPREQLTVWAPVKSPLTSWVKVEFLHETLAARIRRVARLGAWVLSETSELELAISLGADIIETNGQLKPPAPLP